MCRCYAELWHFSSSSVFFSRCLKLLSQQFLEQFVILFKLTSPTLQAQENQFRIMMLLQTCFPVGAEFFGNVHTFCKKNKLTHRTKTYFRDFKWSVAKSFWTWLYFFTSKSFQLPSSTLYKCPGIRRMYNIVFTCTAQNLELLKFCCWTGINQKSSV